MAFATIATVCEMTWAENSVSKRCRLNGKTGLIAVTECSTTGSPHSWAASNIGSYQRAP